VVIYGVGECLYSAIVVPTVAAIAPDALRGRYLAVMGFSWQAGFTVGPAIGASLLTMGPLALPIACAGLCAAALVGALATERGLPAEHLRTPRVIARGASSSALVKWITREHPRVDRVACPWLIEKFVDKDAEFIYVPADQVMAEARSRNATPYDVKDVELGHRGPECSFDAFVRKYGLEKDPAMVYMAKVIRGADTADKTITPESIGIEALLEGVRIVHQPNDQKQREASRPILDALYAYCKTKVAATA
jgi:hypothetical protein